MLLKMVDFMNIFLMVFWSMIFFSVGFVVLCVWNRFCIVFLVVVVFVLCCVLDLVNS